MGSSGIVALKTQQKCMVIKKKVRFWHYKIIIPLQKFYNFVVVYTLDCVNLYVLGAK